MTNFISWIAGSVESHLKGIVLRISIKRLCAGFAGAVAACAMLGITAVSASAYLPATWSSYGSASFTGNVTITLGTKAYPCIGAAPSGTTSQVATGAQFQGSWGTLNCTASDSRRLTAYIGLRAIGQKDGSAYSVDGSIFGTIFPPAEAMWSTVSIPAQGTATNFRSDWNNGSPSTLVLDNELFGTAPSGKQLRISGTLTAWPNTLALL